MSRLFGGVARALLFLICLALAGVLVGLAGVSILAISAQRALQAATYEDVLTEHRIYERLPLLLGAQLSLQLNYQGGAESPGEEPNAGGAPSLVKDLTAAQWSELATELLPRGWLPAQIRALLDGVFRDPPATEVRIDLATLREHLRTGAALRAYRVVAQALPPCDTATGEAFDVARLGSCRPLIAVGGDLSEAEFDRAVAAELEKMPDYTSVPLPTELGGGEPGAPRFTVTTVRTWLIALALAPILPGGLLALLVRHRAALRWIGLPVLAAATVTFSAGLAALSMIPTFETIARMRVPDYWSVIMADAIFEVGGALGRSILEALLLAAGAGVLLGLVIVAASFGGRRTA